MTILENNIHVTKSKELKKQKEQNGVKLIKIVLHKDVDDINSFKDEPNIQKESAKEPEKTVHGWLVAVSCWAVYLLLPMPTSVFGILYSEIFMADKVLATTTGLIFDAQFFVWFFCGIFAGPLCTLFGWRKVVFTGSFLSGISIMLSGFVSNPWVLFLLYSLIFGFGIGIALPTCNLVAAEYFNKKRGLVMAMMTVTMSSTYFVASMMLQILRHSFGRRWSIFILGAVVLNGCAAALMLKPIVKRKSMKTQKNLSSEAKDISQTREISNKIEGQQEKCHSKTKSKDTIREQNNEATQESGSFPHTPTRQTGRNPDTKIKVTPNEEEKEEAQAATFLSFLKITLANLSYLKSARMLIIVLNFALQSSVIRNSLMLVPFMLEEKGYNLDDSSRVLSTVSVITLITRFLIALIIDHINFSTKYICMVGTFCSFLGLLAASFANSWTLFMCALGVFALGSGLSLAVSVIVAVEFMGPQLVGQMYSARAVVASLTFVISGPVLGYVRDQTGSYTLSLMLLSTVSLAAFVLFLFMSCAVEYDKKRGFD